MGRPRLFVSAVSSELAGARRRVAAVLNRLGYDTVSEEDFPTGYGELRRWLAEQIDTCEGVIQLVGDAYGAEPPVSADPLHPWPDPGLGRCSYTQYELLYAWHRAKPAPKRTWVILMGPAFPRDRPLDQLDLPPQDRTVADPAAYQAERRALQRAYVDRLTADNHLRHSAGSETGLENLLLKLKDELAELRQGEKRRWRRLAWALAAVLAGVLVLGGGGWWAFDVLNRKADVAATVSTERIRAHLLEAVEDTYQHDLEAAEAPTDWQERERLRKAAGAQRDTQLARIDDLAVSFAEIERQGEASSVFNELTRILREPGQGVTQALAYMETKRPDILDDVDRIAAGAQTRIRAQLQPLLTSAGLYQAEGNADAARDLYSQILTRAPDWLAAMHEHHGFLIAQGDLAVIRGSLPDAKRDFDEALTRAEHLVALEPDNPGWQRDLSVSLDRVGDIQSAQGDLAGALKSYQESQGIRQRLGDIQSAQWDLAGALKSYQESQGIRERLAAADPSNAGWQRDLAVSHFRVGSIAKQQGRGDLVRSHWGAMLAIFDALERQGLHIWASDRAGLESIRSEVAALEAPGAPEGLETP